MIDREVEHSCRPCGFSDKAKQQCKSKLADTGLSVDPYVMMHGLGIQRLIPQLAWSANYSQSHALWESIEDTWSLSQAWEAVKGYTHTLPIECTDLKSSAFNLRAGLCLLVDSIYFQPLNFYSEEASTYGACTICVKHVNMMWERGREKETERETEGEYLHNGYE